MLPTRYLHACYKGKVLWWTLAIRLCCIGIFRLIALCISMRCLRTVAASASVTDLCHSAVNRKTILIYIPALSHARHASVSVGLSVRCVSLGLRRMPRSAARTPLITGYSFESLIVIVSSSLDKTRRKSHPSCHSNCDTIVWPALGFIYFLFMVLRRSVMTPITRIVHL